MLCCDSDFNFSSSFCAVDDDVDWNMFVLTSGRTQSSRSSFVFKQVVVATNSMHASSSSSARSVRLPQPQRKRQENRPVTACIAIRRTANAYERDWTWKRFVSNDGIATDSVSSERLVASTRRTTPILSVCHREVNTIYFNIYFVFCRRATNAQSVKEWKFIADAKLAFKFGVWIRSQSPQKVVQLLRLFCWFFVSNSLLLSSF